MKSERKATLGQVAQLAGVSPSAASMILNGRTNVSFAPDTIQRVQQCAQQLGYLKKQEKSPCSALSHHKVVFIMAPNITSPYYATLLQSIEQVARSRGYQTVIYNTYRDTENEQQLMTLLEALQPDGIIFSMIPTNTAQVERISHSIPTVVIGDCDESINIDTVETRNYLAGVLMAKHLIELGHQHIAFLSTTLDHSNTARTKRLDGIQSTFQQFCPTGNVLVLSRNISPAEELNKIMLEHSVGYELFEELLADSRHQEVTALVGVNDMVAYGVADAVLAHGFSIPADYSVAGFDNSFPSVFLPVSLTTVEHCITEKGHVAFDILQEKMELKNSCSKKNFITRVEYKQLLVARNSTAPPRKVL